MSLAPCPPPYLHGRHTRDQWRLETLVHTVKIRCVCRWLSNNICKSFITNCSQAFRPWRFIQITFPYCLANHLVLLSLLTFIYLPQNIDLSKVISVSLSLYRVYGTYIISYTVSPSFLLFSYRYEPTFHHQSLEVELFCFLNSSLNLWTSDLSVERFENGFIFSQILLFERK